MPSDLAHVHARGVVANITGIPRPRVHENRVLLKALIEHAVSADHCNGTTFLIHTGKETGSATRCLSSQAFLLERLCRSSPRMPEVMDDNFDVMQLEHDDDDPERAHSSAAILLL